MRILITGGTGLIGRRLARLLADDAREVVVLSRDPDRARDKLPPGVQAIGWDAKTGAGWSDIIDGETAIVNLAGHSIAALRWTAAHKRLVLQSRLDAARAVTDAIDRASAPPRVLLQASAVGYYGDRGEEELSETSAPGSGFAADVCRDWEAATAAITVRQIVLRIGIVLGREGGALPPFVFAARTMVRRFGDGRQWVPWISLDDTARAIRFLIDHPTAAGAVNVCAPPMRNRELMAAVARVVGTPALFPIPTVLLRLMMGEQAGTILGSQRVIPSRLREWGCAFTHDTPEAAIRAEIKDKK